MPLSIRTKLFAILLTTTILVVVGMYAFSRWSLDKGFAAFIESRRREHIENLVGTLSEFYGENNGWSALAGDKRRWIKLLMQSDSHRHYRAVPLLRQALDEAPGEWPPQLPDMQTKKRFLPLEFRVMLLNADKSIIFGRRDGLPRLSLNPILHDGRIVGYLGVLPGKPPKQLGEIRFMERQGQSFILIALTMVLLSAALALMLSYALGRPLKRMADAAKALAVGRYDVRLPVDSNDELGQLARDFNETAAALERSELARRRWVADISHELRTPLAVLRGELEALQDGIRPYTRETVDSLLGDVLRLNRLTDDLYQLSLSDLGALSYRKVPLNPVRILKEDIETLSAEAGGKNLSVSLIDRLARPATIHADPDRLSQLYRNLLTNSINYTDCGGRLEIVVERSGNFLEVVFSDSEPGIPDSELPRLFDRFYRVESSRSRHHGGAGLGLAICANIVAAHNGTIAAGPSKLNGLEIRVRLPLLT